MKYQKFILFLLLTISAVAHAGGAATLIGQKSKMDNYRYSFETKMTFLNDCSENANVQVCECVLSKLQKKYSEKTYLKLDNDLQKGIKRPEFVRFITTAAKECDEEITIDQVIDQATTISEKETQQFIENLQKEETKKNFIPECAAASPAYDKPTALKVCECAYNHMIGDIPRLTQMIIEKGSPDTTNNWGYEYMIECAPEEYTPHVINFFINILNENGIPKSVAQCMANVLKKEYSFKSFITAAFEQGVAYNLMINTIYSKCKDQVLFNDYSNDDAGLQTMGKTVLGGRRGKAKGGFNEDYAEGGSGGIGDGLAGLLGGGGGGIATKAKGSIKTPSMQDIDIKEGSSRSAADIMKVVRQRTPGLRHIYNKYLKMKPGFQGKVVLKFAIASSGEITKIVIESSTTDFSDFDNEIKGAVNRWTFSKISSGKTVVTIPFTFTE
jgi:TonB family protein